MPAPLFPKKRDPLPVVRWYWDHTRTHFNDLSIFTAENDHNPLVAARCPKCNGRGRWFEEDGQGHRDYGCRRCGGIGCVPELAARLFSNNPAPITVTLRADGWITCPGCGWNFSTRDTAVWTGWRHRCGQRIVLQPADQRQE